jgi:hypothetical protein
VLFGTLEKENEAIKMWHNVFKKKIVGTAFLVKKIPWKQLSLETTFFG